MHSLAKKMWSCTWTFNYFVFILLIYLNTFYVGLFLCLSCFEGDHFYLGLTGIFFSMRTYRRYLILSVWVQHLSSISGVYFISMWCLLGLTNTPDSFKRNKVIIIIIIIIIGVQKLSTSSWVVKNLFPDVSMVRLQSLSRVMRFEQSWRYNVTLAKNP